MKSKADSTVFGQAEYPTLTGIRFRDHVLVEMTKAIISSPYLHKENGKIGIDECVKMAIELTEKLLIS